MIHERGYWTSEKETDTHEFDESLAKAMVHLFGFAESVVDIGCGNGEYTRHFINCGIRCKGFDGNPNTPLITNNICKVMDFSQPVDIGKFHLVLSLEVGEHIPAEYEQIFIDNLVKSSSGIIALSWAVEGQPGIGHVNCRNNDYIIKELEKRGFEYVANPSGYLRAKSTLPWFKNTLMVFIK